MYCLLKSTVDDSLTEEGIRLPFNDYTTMFDCTLTREDASILLSVMKKHALGDDMVAYVIKADGVQRPFLSYIYKANNNISFSAMAVKYEMHDYMNDRWIMLPPPINSHGDGATLSTEGSELAPKTIIDHPLLTGATLVFPVENREGHLYLVLYRNGHVEMMEYYDMGYAIVNLCNQ